MSLGFIILRHVNNKLSDYYWKECYTCIRKFYNNQILIVDDSSNKEFLIENLRLINCNVIYDTAHKGAAELLPYYYFHKLRPFDTAIIIHDSIFIQKYINFGLNMNENIRFLWTFASHWDKDILHNIQELYNNLIHSYELDILYKQQYKWNGCFGVMSVIKWSFINKLNDRHQLFSSLLPKINTRDYRCALERVFAIVVYLNDNTIKKTYFGNIHEYLKWNTTFVDYLTKDFSNLQIVKVWSGR